MPESPHEEQILVRRSGPLSGTITVPGAKNSALKLMAATLLADGDYTITNTPHIADVPIMSTLLESLGIEIDASGIDDGILRLHNRGDIRPVASYELVDRIRASINVLGPLLGRCGEVRVALPGGDDFGSRPIDMHLAGLEAMGAKFKFEHGDVIGVSDGLHGAEITLEFPSVGATENLMTAAVFAKGTTTIDNAAREPEIGDLATMLVSMGADIEGIGSSTLVIHGVEKGSLRSTDHRVVPDRVQAATYMAAVGVARGEVRLIDARVDHMDMLVKRFSDMGMRITPLEDGLLVECNKRLKSIDVATLPYPGIATDYKPLIVTMLSVADGVGIVTENLYPGRFRYVEELQRLGADIRTDGHHAVVRGKDSLSGAPVRAPDIRAGAALVVAGLVASGTTVIRDLSHIDRGYEDLVGRLRSVGADIERN